MKGKPLTDHNKIFYQTKSLNLELEDIREEFEICKRAFSEELSRHGGEKRSLASASNNLKNDIDSIFAEDKKDEKRESLLKPLYRKIMLMTHPDKLVNIEDPHLKEVYSEVCRKAMNAMEDLNWYKLYDSAIEIGIKDFDIKIQHINLIKEDQALIEKEISEIKKTIPWLWFHSENDIKNKYLKYFLKNHA